MKRYRVGDYILWISVKRWPWQWPRRQGLRRLYGHSVNWWTLGLGPLWVIWCPIRSQAYLRKRGLT